MKRGSTYAKSEGRRSTISLAALEVFSDLGYHAGTVRQIANRIGMSDAGILHHFPKKSDLLLAALEVRDKPLRERIGNFGTTPDELRSALIAIVREHAQLPGSIRLYCTTLADASDPHHFAHEYFRGRYERLLHLLTDTFDRLNRTGILLPAAPRDVALATMAHLDGVQMQWLVAPEHVDLERQIGMFASGVLGFSPGAQKAFLAGE